MAFATMTVSNCTLSANSAGHDGGGIVNIGKLTLRDSTVSGNTAPLGTDLYGTASISDSTIGSVYYPCGPTRTAQGRQPGAGPSWPAFFVVTPAC
jgi:hypothetical protein